MTQNEEAVARSKYPRARSKRKPNSALILTSIIILITFRVQSLELESAFCRCEKFSPFDKPFVVLWNSPTEGCHVNFSVKIELEKFGILTNTKQTWDGEVVTVFYNAQLGLYPYIDEENSSVTYNGGLPQLINLNKHLSKSSIDIAAKIPNPDFSGVAVIDWEGWRPLWETNFGKKRIYRTKSAQLIEEEKVFKKKDEIAREAKKKFEKAARDIMVGTLNLAKKLRPKALWGFYGFPGCYGNITTGYTCRTQNKQLNDKIQWLFGSSTALFPSIYLMEEHVQNQKFVAERLTEAFRVSLLVAQRSNLTLPVFPYLRSLYLTKSRDFKMLNEDDLENAIGQAADLGCAGLILWGNHKDERTSKAVCAQYNDYVNKKLGPYVSLLTEELETCSSEKCSSNGRCIDRSRLASELLKSQQNISRNSCNFINEKHKAFSNENLIIKENYSGKINATEKTAGFLVISGKRRGNKNITNVLLKNNNHNKNAKLKKAFHYRTAKGVSSKQIVQENGKHIKTSGNLTRLLPDDHKNMSLGSSLNKTQHKKIPFDPYWNKNGVFGSSKRHKVDFLQISSKSMDVNHPSISTNMSHLTEQLSHQRTGIHTSHPMTDDINAKRSHDVVKSPSSHNKKPSNNQSTKEKHPLKRGYSASVSEETAVHIPSVYIILITVTLGGALLMTVIYVAIYYAVNVHGRSHDYQECYNGKQRCGSSAENPFSMDAGPWWNENIDNEEKPLINEENVKR